MVARSVSLGVILVLSALTSLGLSPYSAAQAAYPGWSGYATAQKNQFRPWSRANSSRSFAQRQSPMRAVASRGMVHAPSGRSSAVSSDRSKQPPVFAGRRAGARKAVPITRGQELGLRFRPDDRETPYGQTLAPRGDGGPGGYSDELQSQFRPVRPKRRQTYEELQAESASVPSQMGPAGTYPMLPPPLPAYPGVWPGPRW